MWTPKLHVQEVLDACQENNNPYDRHAIATWKRASAPDPDEVVSHIPNVISHFTWFIIAHGAVVTVRVVSVKHRRLPLIHEGLEMPIEACVVMANSNENKQALDKYIELVNNHCEEPVGDNFGTKQGIGVDNDISSTDESDINEQ